MNGGKKLFKDIVGENDTVSGSARFLLYDESFSVLVILFRPFKSLPRQHLPFCILSFHFFLGKIAFTVLVFSLTAVKFLQSEKLSK